jgi:hypothetical protein
MRSSHAPIVLATLVISLAGCGSNNNQTVPSPVSGPTTAALQFIQIERLARPAIKEAFQMYNDHDGVNRSNPYTDQTLPNAITAYEGPNGLAGRSPAWAAALTSILTPDELSADLSQPGPGAYLGVETGGATGGKFGGRTPHDDAIAIDLGAIYGNTLSALGVVPDDGKESYCLANDNVPAPGTDSTTTFPYFASPQ